MGQTVLAIDPGPLESAYVVWDGEKILGHGKIQTPDILIQLDLNRDSYKPCPVVIEMIASYGMKVGAEVFETCVNIGRMLEHDHSATRMFRRDVKLHICDSPRANDSTIRQALIDRFGLPGTKKCPGLTYGLKADAWQAFALAVTAYDKMQGTTQ